MDQPFLIPPCLQDWLPEDHLARFIADVSETLDLSGICASYERKDGRGLAAYHPLMLTRLLLYGYCVGVRSSRRIEKATYDDLAFRYLAADQHPDHDTIAHFRREHLAELGGLFVQALRLCQQAGLVKLGVVALDGTKILANASGQRALKHAAMEAEQQRLEALVRTMLNEVEQVDASEDARWGQGQPEPALPAGLARAQDRLEKLRQAKQELEEEARQRVNQAYYPPSKPGPKSPQDSAPRISPQEREKRKAELQRARRNAVSPTRAYNFSDPDSRLMHDNGLKRIVPSYNAQLAVDAAHQIIVAAELTQQVNDLQQLVPMFEALRQTAGALPETLLADAGYWDTMSIERLEREATTVLVSPDGSASKTPKRLLTNPAAQRLRQALRQPAAQALYRLRKITVEPVLGQIKELRHFRRFSFRGLAQVAAEWKLVCLTHNLLKLHRCSPA